MISKDLSQRIKDVIENEQVRREAPAGRLLDWQARDGWEPLCDALGVPVPDEPFPRVNTREEWRARAQQ